MRKLLLALPLLLLCACADDSLPNAQSGLVVEGFIENEGFPVVMVTRSLPVSTDKRNLHNLDDYLVKWAKVSVVNREDTVILTGMFDKGYLPPYIYTTGRMRGKVGETYKLIVEYDGMTACATTTITVPPQVEGYTVEKCEGNDTLYQIKARMKAEKDDAAYYQFFTRVGGDRKQFLASFLGNYSDSVVAGSYEMPVYRGHQSMTHDYTPYFLATDTVAVKCCRLDETEYNFWKTYTSSLHLSGAAMMSTTDNIPSNILGGSGYWFGYGSTTSYFIISDSIHNKADRRN